MDQSNASADQRHLREEKITHEIIGSAMEVLNELGHGLVEKPYENALAVELRLRNIPFDQQQRFEVLFKGFHVGEYIPDLVVDNVVVVDPKVIDRIGEHELGKMLNYLRITKLGVGLVLNFRRARLEWKRVVL